MRQPRVLILGCGDVGVRLIQAYRDRVRLFAVARSADGLAQAREAGGRALRIDLDDRHALRRLKGLAQRIVYAAPPPDSGRTDPRARRAVTTLANTSRWVYLSTSGVYGDCAGAWVDETRPVAPRNDRAFRRVAAERQMRATRRALVLRVPGIYAADRLPIARLQQGTPALRPEDDGYTNHVHADDLARIAYTALWRGGAGRVIHAVDQSELRMGEWFDAVADRFGLPRPPRLEREALKARVSPMLWSFMGESRRLRNDRLRRELRVRLRWPTVLHFLDTTVPELSTPRAVSARA
jgi:nucleoside-diphosphate-sugar epimerase